MINLKGEHWEYIYIEEKQFKLSYSYGLGGIGKYGRYFTVKGSLASEIPSFDGTIEIMLPNKKENILYKKNISWESKNGNMEIPVEFEFSLPLNDDTAVLIIELKNDNGKVLLNKKESIMIGNYYLETYIGILSDEVDKLSYLSKPGTRLFHLGISDISELEYGLDLLDVIILNNFDSKRLSKEQIEVLNKWVLAGGSLVIGTGEGARGTTSNLDRFGVRRKEGQQGTYFTFGMNKKILEEFSDRIYSYVEQRRIIEEDISNRNNILKEKGIELIQIDSIDTDRIQNEIIDEMKISGLLKVVSEVYLEGATPLMNNGIQYPAYIKNIGYGNIQLYKIDLGLEKENVSVQLNLLYTILNNLSSYKKNQLSNEYYNNSYISGVLRGLNYSDTNNIPNVWGYIVVIFIYLILIGPVLYLALKKMKKANYIWAVIPILSITFSCMVYIIGAKTRMNDPFSGYIHLKTYKEDSVVMEEVYFSVTNINNDSLVLDIEIENDIKDFYEQGLNYYKVNMETDTYDRIDKVGNVIGDNGQENYIEISDKAAFSTNYYQVKDTYVEENKINYDLYYNGSQLSGSIKNGFNYDILNTGFISDGYLYNIGELKAKEKINIQDVNKVYLSVAEEIYSSEFIYNLLGIKANKQELVGDAGRKYAVMQHLIERGLYNQSNGYLVGFAENDKQSKVVEELYENINSDGVTAVIIPIEVEYKKDDIIFGPSIMDYMVLPTDSYNMYHQKRYMMLDEINISYEFPQNIELLELMYLEERNSILENDYISSFSGSIYFKNRQSNDFDLVFSEGNVSSVSNLSDYINSRNEIEVRYKVDIKSYGKQMLLPHISYIAKER